MNEKLDIIAIGESLVELSSDSHLRDTDCLKKYYGGDALSVAVAASRMGSSVGFISRVGDDVFKDYLLDSWQTEGLDISQVKISQEQNGVYFIARPEGASKEFAYYRKRIAPAKLSLDDISEDYISNSKAVYASGITQSLSLSAKEAVAESFKIAKKNGIITAYDPNYSASITTPETAKEDFNKVINDIDILFMSAKYDTTNILELNSVENIIKRIWDMGVGTVVIKASPDGGYYTGYNGNIVFTEFYAHDVVDTTCSGDAFNGGFLHAITHGLTPIEASRFASIVAGLQAKSIGAIKSIPYKDEVYEIFEKGVFNA
ncbi:sugar kinase [bacterium]|nr:sugar kinase [bacterium]